MPNDFNSFYMLARRLNRNSIEVKFIFNLIDTREVVSRGNHFNKFFENEDFLNNIHFKEY